MATDAETVESAGRRAGGARPSPAGGRLGRRGADGRSAVTNDKEDGGGSAGGAPVWACAAVAWA